MQKELLRKSLGEGGEVVLKIDGLELVAELRGHGKAVLDKLKVLIPGDIDDKVIDAVEEFLAKA